MAAEVTTQPVTDIVYNGGKFNGTLTDMGGYASVYVFFKYRVKPVPDEPWDSYSETPKELRTTTGTYEYTVVGLDPDTTYEVRSSVEHQV